MTGENEPTDQERPGRSPWDRRIKLGFLIALIGIGVLVWRLQRRTPGLGGWGEDLQSALDRGAPDAENRRILILFHGSPPSQKMRNLAWRVIDQNDNKKAILRGNFIPVHVDLPRSLKSPLAQRYKVRTLPTMIIISPEGKELNRREGYVGFVEFRKGFLDCSNVVKPQQ